MKTALITTTINVPTVLELYRQHGPDVRFFVASDLKTDKAAGPMVAALNNAWFLLPEAQGWKCSELIGWNCIQRRNIALLEAIRWGAEIIVSIDDDNIVMPDKLTSYFGWFSAAFGNMWGGESRPISGLKVSSPNKWFDVGQLLDPISPHRGFPISIDASSYEVGHAVDVKVGVAAGVCLGDPDISAVTRISRNPLVHHISELLNSGIVVDPETRTVFNSQNTAFIRELAPAMFMMPGVGRYDDIYASLICQRVMRPRGLHVHFGRPFVYQQRNPHNLVKDLRAEIDGMENVEKLATYLATGIALDPNDSIITQLRAIYNGFGKLPHSYGIVPAKSVEAALAFLEDIEALL